MSDEVILAQALKDAGDAAWVYEWLLAEARWWAENWKCDSVRERWYLSEPSPFPWETLDGEQADG